jgi:hypothetical protein
MRLTLRTLLAWLDAVLPADEQVQLGEKVSASQTASVLAERIRLAVNRPAIAAPAPDARGLADDANSVADFLDNTLSADQIEAFERICLESDMHLAEVAACHAMLATLARQPVAGLAPVTRQRLQTLLHDRLERERFGNASGGPHAAGDDHQESRETARALRAALGTSDVVVDEAGGRGPAAPGLEAASPAEGLQVDPTPTGAGHAAAGRGGRSQSSPAAWWSAIIAASLVLALVGVPGSGGGRARQRAAERGRGRCRAGRRFRRSRRPADARHRGCRCRAGRSRCVVDTGSRADTTAQRDGGCGTGADGSRAAGGRRGRRRHDDRGGRTAAGRVDCCSVTRGRFRAAAVPESRSGRSRGGAGAHRGWRRPAAAAGEAGGWGGMAACGRRDQRASGG